MIVESDTDAMAALDELLEKGCNAAVIYLGNFGPEGPTALFAEGLWTALLFRALIGIGLAGTYMPGLRILSDHVEGPLQSRAIAFYTSSFSIGAALSFLMAGEISLLYDWQLAASIAACFECPG